MAKKKRTPEQEAISRAKKAPERKWFASRRMAWANFTWPGKWGFWTNYNEVAFDAGTPRYKFHGPEVPEAVLGLNFRVWPPRLVLFWHRKRVLWLGDREWKRGLRG